ncbi:N-acetylmuramoyl-L-alanine amidase [Caldibacillus debilis]|uniref:N-acetylmuramoyl-L-alanine amidase n=1 Tax=Caldibacillus debilis TaxID=301148 RepID=A0A150LPQ7_9BACI|nr:N-acetylmuramoyl-L-alanine amidase [Caldibacillus debilis]KYD14240.1 N-acetylmuramoyl-L-alanine amidase [Caldibacillus debilis]
MVKVFLDPGHGGNDPGSSGNGLKEKEVTFKIAQKIEQILKNEYEGVSIKWSRRKDETVSLKERTDLANQWGADLYLAVHVNAGGGTGFESYVYLQVPVRTKSVQEDIHREVLKRSGFRDRGMKQADFHVLRESKMDAVLTENGFIDNPDDAAKLKDPAFLEKIVRGHAEGIAKHYRLARKAEGKEDGKRQEDPGKSEKKSLYKVQIGAFEDLENAKRLAERAKQAGFDVAIIKE